ncbi:MAG: lipoprotein NlpI [bacterium ADurb.Bin236]|nr:MAG: lipoprotein NlpI [bacterium ADurb.Bin236]
MRAFALWGLPAMLFLVSLIYLGSSLDPFTPVKTGVLRLFAFSGLLAWVYDCASSGRLFWRRTSADIPLAAMLVWLGTSALWSVNKPLAASQWMDAFSGAVVFYAAAMSCRGAEDAKTILARSGVPLFFMAALGACDLARISVFPWDTLLIDNRLFSAFSAMGVGGAPPAQWTHSFDGRVSASFGNPVYMAGMPLLLLAPLWALLAGEKHSLRGFFYAAMFAAAEFLLLATFSRAAWAATIAGGAAYWLLNRRGGASGARGRAGAVLALAVLAATVAGFTVRNVRRPAEFSIQQRVATVADSQDASLWQRALIWKTAWEAFKDNPVKGVGLNNYVVWHPRYQVPFFESERWAARASFPDRVHNEYLDAAAETGAVGLALLAGAMAAIFGMGLKAARGGGERGRLAAAITAGGVSTALYALMQFPFHVPAVAAYMWTTAGLLPGLASGRDVSSVRIWRKAAGRERVLLGLVLAAALALAVPFFARQTIANIRFSWAVRHVDKAPPEKVMEMMRAAVADEPGNMEMTVRFGMTANTLAAREKDAGRAKALHAAVRDESLRGLRYFPYEPRLMENLGVALIRLGSPDAAVGPLKNSVAINPENALSFYNLGIAYYLLNNYNAAVYSYIRAFELDPDLPGVKRNLGLAHLKAGNVVGAEEMFVRALRDEAADKTVLNSLGMAMSRQGKCDGAISSYRRALEIDPGYADARGNLAIELIETGDFAAAETELLKVLEVNPGSEAARHHLERAREMSGGKGLQKK